MAALLEDVIYPEEITHCAAGVRWFTFLSQRERGEAGGTLGTNQTPDLPGDVASSQHTPPTSGCKLVEEDKKVEEQHEVSRENAERRKGPNKSKDINVKNAIVAAA